MPTPPYTSAEQDALIDGLRTDLTALDGRVGVLETLVSAIETNVSDLLSRVGSLENDNDTNIANISALATAVATLQSQVADIENISLPAVDTLQDDVAALNLPKRQDNDQDELSKPQVVLRPSVQRVRRPDGRMAQRVVKPR